MKHGNVWNWNVAVCERSIFKRINTRNAVVLRDLRELQKPYIEGLKLYFLANVKQKTSSLAV